MTPANLCGWCGKRHKRKSQGKGAAVCCSSKCQLAYMAHGMRSKADIAARIAHIPLQPKGCTSVEEFLARGGRIYTEAPGPSVMASTSYRFVRQNRSASA